MVKISERSQTRVRGVRGGGGCYEKMASPSAAVTNNDISQIIKQAVPEIHEEGDEIRFGSFNS